MGQALLGERRTLVRPAVGAMAVIGLVHPIAAVGALDVARLTRTIDDPDVELPDWAPAALAIIVVVSIVIAVALWAQAATS